jgi:hypothetical protein
MKGERPLFPNSQLVSEESRKRWRARVAFLLEHPEGLTDWEAAFAQDIEKQLSEGRDLTLPQSSKLNQIFHKVEEAEG